MRITHPIGTLMNHSSIVYSISKHVNLSQALSNLDLSFILGESNSISGQGSNGLTNVFGSALWLLNYDLWCASQVCLPLHSSLALLSNPSSIEYKTHPPPPRP
jgi:hypothetical protein